MKYFYLILTAYMLYTSAIYSAQKKENVQKVPNGIKAELTTDALRDAHSGGMQQWEPSAIQKALLEKPNQFATSLLHVVKDKETAQVMFKALTPENVCALLIHTNNRRQNAVHQHCCHDCPELLHFILQTAQDLNVLHQVLNLQDFQNKDTPAHKAIAAKQARNITVLSYWGANFTIYNHDKRGAKNPTMLATRLNWQAEFQQACNAGYLKRDSEEKAARQKEAELAEAHFTTDRILNILAALREDKSSH